MRVVIRGFKNNQRVFEDTLDLAGEREMEAILPEIATKHGAILADALHMIEMEFLDIEDPNERFFRFGTDPRGMVMPIEIEFPKQEPAAGAESTDAASNPNPSPEVE
jgi:hypothetical protein